MPLYNRQNLSGMPQAAQSAMSSASNTMANQQKQTTTVTKKERNFWDDLEKGAKAVGAVAGAANNTVSAIGKGIDLYDDIKVKNAYDNIAKTFAEGGYEAIQRNPDMQDYHHSLALGKFVKDRANTTQGRLEMMKKADEIADMQYQDFRNQAILVKEAWDKGDMERYMNGMEQLVANAPFPYRLAPDGQGNFDELFRSDKAGGEWVKTGRKVTPQQAFEQMNGIMRGEQQVLRGIDGKIQPYNEAFNRRAAANYVNTAYGNGNLSADPKNYTPLYDRNGNFAGAGVIQNPWLNEDGSLGAYGKKAQIKLFDRNGKAIGMVDGWNGAMQRGLFMANHVRAAGRAAGGGRGGGSGHGGGTGGSLIGPKGILHPTLMEAGFVYDKNQHWYYKPFMDENGKMSPDYSQPLKEEFLRELAGRANAQNGGANNDPLNVRGKQQDTQGKTKQSTPAMQKAASAASGEKPTAGQTEPGKAEGMMRGEDADAYLWGRW